MSDYIFVHKYCMIYFSCIFHIIKIQNLSPKKNEKREHSKRSINISSCVIKQLENIKHQKCSKIFCMNECGTFSINSFLENDWKIFKMNINLKKKYLHKLVALKVEKIRCIFCYTCNLLYLWKICIVNNMSIENEMWGINISIISVSFYIRTHESIHTCYLRWELFHFLCMCKRTYDNYTLCATLLLAINYCHFLLRMASDIVIRSYQDLD